jgi:phosphoglycerate dehydrogenase-like enzyme
MSARTVSIAILDDYQDAAARYFPEDELRAVCEPAVTIHRDRAESREELVRRAGSCEVVVVMRERSAFPAEVIEQLAETRLIVTSGARNAAIDVAAARARGIVVWGTPGPGSGAAERCGGGVVALVRRIPAEDAGVRAGRWGVHVGDTLRGKTLGIVGLGGIGREVARYGQAFGMPVLAWSRSLTREAAAVLRVEAVGRDAVFREADVVSVHLKLTEETRGSVGWRELGLMKRSAYFVNTARGALVDEAALVRALESGKIRGAALDVFTEEPLPGDSPLRGLDNVVLTPHVGYVSEDRYRDYYGQAAETIAHYVQGEVIRELP